MLSWLRLRDVIISVPLILLLVAAGIGVHRLNNPPRPPQAATVSVPSTFQYPCNGDQATTNCIKQRYQRLTLSKGPKAAFTTLKAEYNTNDTVHAYCHALAHVIGRTEADVSKNIDDAYAHGDNFCWSGYYHGVMESLVQRIGKQNITAKLPTICAELKKDKPYSFYHFNCVHGLGHGIMDVNKSELFTSLTTCDILQDTWEQESCYGGVFMENVMDEVNSGHITAYLKDDQPMYPCTAVDEKYKEQCYLMQTSHALRLANNDFATVFAECAGVDSNFVDVCYQSLGRDASGTTSSTVETTKANCMWGPTQDARANCVTGAVKDFISYYSSDKQATQLCNSLDSSLQAGCQTTKTQYYATF